MTCFQEGGGWTAKMVEQLYDTHLFTLDKVTMSLHTVA